MAEDRKREGLGDGQGTHVGRPASAGSQGSGSSETGGGRASTGRPTGAGSEAAGTDPQAAPIDGHDEEHRGGYGGSGGRPVESSEKRQGLK